MSEGERVGHRGVRGGGREEIRSRVGPTTDFSTTREKSACPSPVRNPGCASDVRRGALPFFEKRNRQSSLPVYKNVMALAWYISGSN
jgi:hypothetical protein